MDPPEEGAAAALAALGAVVLALAGLAFSFTNLSERLEAWLLDREWSVLRAVAPRDAPDDIVIVGIDEASIAGVPQPLGVWNEPLGEVLVRIASARPRAIALDVVLPDRSLDALHPGLDRALLVGLAAARDNGPVVAALSIDARTRSARPIFAPYLAVLGEDGLGIDLMPRDIDGATRRFTLAIPTQDGAFPTFVGRVCTRLTGRCSDGLLDFALGAPLQYVPFREVLQMRDAGRARALFGGRIVLVGNTLRYSDRIAMPFALAAWQPGARDVPGIVAHAQALRTALAGTAPREASRPLPFLLVMLAALLLLVRQRGRAVAGAAAGLVFLAGLAVFALHAETYVPVGAAMATLLAAAAVRVFWRRRSGG
jgi:CHASE2 domain-containing sensor protein